MDVSLIFSPSHDDMINILYSACRQCYYTGFVGDPDSFSGVSIEKKAALIHRIISSGHHSVLEHVSFTFAIGGLSRACAQQLTRHRVASYSMQSMRYCDTGSNGIVTPKDFPSKSAKLLYESAAKKAAETYNELIKLGVSKEDARGILPINWKSNLVMTMNCRELMHFFSERLCVQAQDEIRTLAKKMYNICVERLPEVFESAGAKCVVLGYCNEGERSCHKYPLKETLLNIS